MMPTQHTGPSTRYIHMYKWVVDSNSRSILTRKKALTTAKNPMGRQVVAPQPRAPPVKKLTHAATVPAAVAPLATSGLIVNNRDLGGASKSEISVKELIMRERGGGDLLDDDGKRKKVPVLKNGRWVMEFPTQARHHAEPSTLPASSSSAGQRTFELTFEGSASLGISLKDLDRSNGETRLPPPGYHVVVGAVQPGSLAAQQKLRPGVAVMQVCCRGHAAAMCRCHVPLRLLRFVLPRRVIHRRTPRVARVAGRRRAVPRATCAIRSTGSRPTACPERRCCA